LSTQTEAPAEVQTTDLPRTVSDEEVVEALVLNAVSSAVAGARRAQYMRKHTLLGMLTGVVNDNHRYFLRAAETAVILHRSGKGFLHRPAPEDAQSLQDTIDAVLAKSGWDKWLLEQGLVVRALRVEVSGGPYDSELVARFADAENPDE
jgi:hypothetical protein